MGSKLRGIDFSKWLLEHVNPDDYAMCKLDIEGAEFKLVPRMLATGALCLCDRMSIEWHAHLVDRDGATVAEVKKEKSQFEENKNGVMSEIPAPQCPPDRAPCKCKHAHPPGARQYAKLLRLSDCALPGVVQGVRHQCDS